MKIRPNQIHLKNYQDNNRIAEIYSLTEKCNSDKQM